MSAQVDALPDDPGLLKAMLIAEQLESERLRQIIREFQRHRFGRRAESLPEDQLQLALEDAEQAADKAEAEQKNLAERKVRAARRRTNRGELPTHLPRIETVVDVERTTITLDPLKRLICHCHGSCYGNPFSSRCRYPKFLGTTHKAKLLKSHRDAIGNHRLFHHRIRKCKIVWLQ
ncbi:hypothetical protein RSO01_69990 [Reyranella soli]|uniref:Transposase TnpC homeodomain domain-containing protein n=1 Tax=Reyranella soli TaxID=1230389 RepID=A0A512NLL2_9HYPH|nr:hypothetical protein RSO01_69990 [Reyranella soli]